MITWMMTNLLPRLNLNESAPSSPAFTFSVPSVLTTSITSHLLSFLISSSGTPFFLTIALASFSGSFRRSASVPVTVLLSWASCSSLLVGLSGILT